MNTPDPVEALVEAFREKVPCIQSDCDGFGNIPNQVGENEWEAQQCQYCDEVRLPFIEDLRHHAAQLIKIGQERATDYIQKHTEYASVQIVDDEVLEAARNLSQ